MEKVGRPLEWASEQARALFLHFQFFLHPIKKIKKKFTPATVVMKTSCCPTWCEQALQKSPLQTSRLKQTVSCSKGVCTVIYTGLTFAQMLFSASEILSCAYNCIKAKRPLSCRQQCFVMERRVSLIVFSPRLHAQILCVAMETLPEVYYFKWMLSGCTDLGSEIETETIFFSHFVLCRISFKAWRHIFRVVSGWICQVRESVVQPCSFVQRRSRKLHVGDKSESDRSKTLQWSSFCSVCQKTRVCSH